MEVLATDLGVLKAAMDISRPLALIGLVSALLFLLFRQLIARDLFPKLSRALGADLLRRVVDRMFWLAVLVTVLGFCGYLVEQVFPPPIEDRDPGPARELARSVLEKMHARDYAGVYESYSRPVREALAFAQFRDVMQMTLSQLPGPPAYRSLVGEEDNMGFLALTFEAEFDQLSKLKELVTFTWQERRWQLYRIDVMLASWPHPSSMQGTRFNTAGSLGTSLGAIPEPEQDDFLELEVRGKWVPLPGWVATVIASGARQDRHTCDVELRELVSGQTIHLASALGACDLDPGNRLTLVGKIIEATPQAVTVAMARFWVPEGQPLAASLDP